MEEVKANSVYDLLVKIGGASESERASFVYHHCMSKELCDEWRFGGKLGFGGKYRSIANRVDCYKEDDTPERIEIIKELNNLLNKLV
jgi:hypothetical protein